MKKILALLMAAVTVASVTAGCGSASGGSQTSDVNSSQSSQADSDNGDSENEIIEKKEKTSSNASKSSKESERSSVSSKTNTKLAKSFKDAKDLKYVMVYNPAYSPEKTFSTGKIKDYVDTSMKRADDLSQSGEGFFTDQTAFDDLLKDDDYSFADDRAVGLVPTYKKGDKHTFYYSEADITGRENTKTGSFVCAYEGKNCYVWILTSEKSKQSKAVKIGEDFDKNIYSKTVETYGKPRYANDGGKISLLFHPDLYTPGGTYRGGYFYTYEILKSTEISPAKAKLVGANLDHAIIHINSKAVGKEDDKAITSTAAHEFQHLINASDYFYSKAYGKEYLNSISTWLNEGMSGFVEDNFYSDTYKNKSKILSSSDLVRYGQSLYNFTIDNSKGDIGAYGSVYMFSHYLEKLGGKDVFKKLHSYWRDNFSASISEAESLRSVLSSKESKIMSAYTYPANFKISDKDNEFISKLTLGFYMSMMQYNSKDDPKEFKSLDIRKLLYDKVSPAVIEGGGRIIFAVKKGKFEIPSDSDKGLIFIGFDKDFNQITDIVTK